MRCDELITAMENIILGAVMTVATLKTQEARHVANLPAGLFS